MQDASRIRAGAFTVQGLMECAAFLIILAIGMRKQNVIWMLGVIVLAFVVMLVWIRRQPRAHELVDRGRPITYSSQALCFMKCEGISQEQVAEVIATGIINLNRSDRKSKPCPVYALQGTLATGQSLRVVLSQCTDRTTVLTSYYLHRDTVCNCPPPDTKTLR
jgi:Domain of unknown function (DUF4258)